MSTDVLGNEVTLADEASLSALDDFVEGFIASEARAANILSAQEDGSAIVQAYCAALHMFAESGDAVRNARPFADRAQAHAAQATPREQRFVPRWRPGSRATCRARSACTRSRRASIRATWPR